MSRHQESGFDLPDRPDRGERAGVVDEQADWPKIALDRGERLRDRIEVDHIDRESACDAPFGGDRLGDGVDLLGRSRKQGDLGAFPGMRLRDRPANPTAGPGDNSDFACELHVGTPFQGERRSMSCRRAGRQEPPSLAAIFPAWRGAGERLH